MGVAALVWFLPCSGAALLAMYGCFIGSVLCAC